MGSMKDTYFQFRISTEELDKFKEHAAEYGYDSTADLLFKAMKDKINRDKKNRRELERYHKNKVLKRDMK